MAELRRDMMDDLSRALDAPRPRKYSRVITQAAHPDFPRFFATARRHQVFETELVRNPERITSHVARGESSTKGAKSGSSSKRKRGEKGNITHVHGSDTESVKDYVAFPDLRGLEEEAWVDLERMGISMARPA
jgi:hypothetical protein